VKASSPPADAPIPTMGKDFSAGGNGPRFLVSRQFAMLPEMWATCALFFETAYHYCFSPFPILPGEIQPFSWGLDTSRGNRYACRHRQIIFREACSSLTRLPL
jgi:hypothetical protein